MNITGIVFNDWIYFTNCSNYLRIYFKNLILYASLLHQLQPPEITNVIRLVCFPRQSYLFIYLLTYLFIYYLWLFWVSIAARGLSLVSASGSYSSLRCVGLSLRWLLLLRSTGSRQTGFSSCGSQALQRRLSSCGAQAYLLHNM